MPRYDYKCTPCKKKFELERRVTDESVVLCPKCQEPAMRQISQTSFVLKGSGWYSDGYSGKGRA